MKISLSTLYILTAVDVVRSQSGSDAKNLRKQLFEVNGYDKKILPLIDQRDKVVVYVHLDLLAIHGLNEVTETLTTAGYLRVSWFDEYLVWDPELYGGIKYYLWPQEDVWKPNVALSNSVQEQNRLESSNVKVDVDHDGFVGWYPFKVFQSKCNVDITYFPFDVQTCDLTFMEWSYGESDVSVHILVSILRSIFVIRVCSYPGVLMFGDLNGVSLEQYQENSVWEVIGSNWTALQEFGDITFTIIMKRKPLYVLLSVILPIILLAVLNVFVFILPCESGERAGYVMTVFLALTVFLTIVAQSMPANSDTVAIFAIYVIIQTIQSTVITLWALLTIRLCSNETVVPAYLVKLTRLINCLQCKRNRQNFKIESDGCSNQNYNCYVVSMRLPKASLTKVAFKDNVKINGDSSVADSREVSGTLDEVTWWSAVRAIDFVLFIVFLTSVFVSTSVCFIVTATSN